MRRIIFAALMSGLLVSVAAADDWSGVPASGTSMPVGAVGCYQDGVGFVSVPPCGSGTFIATPDVGPEPLPGSGIVALPSGVTGANSFLFLFSQGVMQDASSPTGWTYVYGRTPLSAFAKSETVTAIGARVSALEAEVGTIATLNAQIGALSSELNAIASYIPAVQQQMEEATWRGAAMAAALDSVGPAAGKRNRLGTNAATVNGETAVALNYVYAGDTMDVSAGVAYSEGEAISKVGVGFSW
jgi:hypothetical protein